MPRERAHFMETLFEKNMFQPDMLSGDESFFGPKVYHDRFDVTEWMVSNESSPAENPWRKEYLLKNPQGEEAHIRVTATWHDSDTWNDLQIRFFSINEYPTGRKLINPIWFYPGDNLEPMKKDLGWNKYVNLPQDLYKALVDDIDHGIEIFKRYQYEDNI